MQHEIKPSRRNLNRRRMKQSGVMNMTNEKQIQGLL